MERDYHCPPHMPAPNVYIETFGCQMNELDSELVRGHLQSLGYSFTTDPNARGAPSGHTLPIREVILLAGAGFVVVVCGEIMRMPGLPKVPSADFIRLNDKGQIEGLF